MRLRLKRETGGQRIPRVQIPTAENLWEEKEPQTPFGFVEGYKAAAGEDPGEGKQGLLLWREASRQRRWPHGEGKAIRRYGMA